MMTYWAQCVDDDCEDFCMFWTKASLDDFLRRYSTERWKFGRLINGVEITDGWA